MGKDVLGTVYETLLCSPGMNEAVKIDQKISRKTVLLLSGVIERSLKEGATVGDDLVGIVPAEDIGALKKFSDECLEKAGLKQLQDKLKALQK
ncbi:hypothetical protein [Mucilaginibacter ginsenosidivorans]|uniref:Uncharacterized protein n=1 Tax=Mucilaginibacter ginsenosidivorans TaxID=398053 RepID=A0A5B8UUK4_9SPHI|nr:hypothetical protein [Mucilaginibacter ginsenosidivorans]QEC62589.1 hypothetical protein FRZ54_08295 [Mucilaginibacter ginsenosidivorans]